MDSQSFKLPSSTNVVNETLEKSVTNESGDVFSEFTRLKGEQDRLEKERNNFD